MIIPQAVVTEPTRNAYTRDVSEIYESFYGGRGQDFAGDALQLGVVVRELNPTACSVLDVGCGPGSHLASLETLFDRAEGVELSESMRAVAASRVSGPVHAGDMRTFDLERSYDAVLCLTSTIGYCEDTDELFAAVASMARHLAVGGVLVVDPYWTPQQCIDGHVSHDHVRTPGGTIVRLSQSRRHGERVRHVAHYLVADDDGVRHFGHVQCCSLFTLEQYLEAFERSGLSAAHVEASGGFADRGLLVGVRR